MERDYNLLTIRKKIDDFFDYLKIEYPDMPIMYITSYQLRNDSVETSSGCNYINSEETQMTLYYGLADALQGRMEAYFKYLKTK